MRSSRRWTRASVYIVAVLVAYAAGCSNAPSSSNPAPATADVTALIAAGDPERGAAIFLGQAADVAAPACVTCHAVEAGAAPTSLGPNLTGIAIRAGTTVPNQSAEAYLWESIVAPNTHLAPGYSENIMLTVYGDLLTEQDIADVVRYLLTLES
ncbi:MAG: c-type cytochrome [Chloroflexales bacterium]|nr:c-type cytochrome [Chloroflexales bacterium]